MSDQSGPQPTSPYPQQPAPGGIAPPPPPPPGMFPDQAAQPPGYPPLSGPIGAPARAPRKKRTGLIIGIIVAVILLCGLAALGIGALSGGNSEKGTIALAEKHFETAMNNVEAASTSIKKASSGSRSDISAATADANEKLRTSRDEIAKATAEVEQLKDSQGRTDYLASLKAATVMLGDLQDMVAYMDTATGLAAKAVQAASLAKSGDKSLNSAVHNGNASKYSPMRSDAVSASTNYTKAGVLFREANSLDPSAGLDKAAVYAEKRKLQADVVVRMADEGRANRISAYNADIKKQAALGKKAESAGTPAIIADPNWAENRLSDIGAKIDTVAKQADDLRSKALKELGYQ